MIDLTGKRILIVEDEPIVAMMVEDMLADLGALAVGPVTSLAGAAQFVSIAAGQATRMDSVGRFEV